jgi:predicted GNAT family acetyltransferase
MAGPNDGATNGGATAAGGTGVLVVRNDEKTRYEARLDGVLAGTLSFRTVSGHVTLVHTEVEPAFEGRGVGAALARTALDDARARGLEVRPLCPFVQSFIARHPAYADLVVALPHGGEPATG